MSVGKRPVLVSRFLLGLVLCLSFWGTTSTRSADDGIRIDVPVGARVRIENQFGQITAEVWKQKYVSVSASIEGDESEFTRSPIVIENKAKLLLISIIRTPVDPRAAITLNVKLPESCLAEIVTGLGSISMRGILPSASLKSVSGDIRAELSNPLNADISARTTNGTIRSELSAPLSDGGHVLETRSGSGDHVLRIYTERGVITLALDANFRSADSLAPPRLLGSENISK
jgi:hypothetical protein